MKWLILFIACSSLSFFPKERLNLKDDNSFASVNTTYVYLTFEKNSSRVHPELMINLHLLKDVLISNPNYSIKLIGVALQSETKSNLLAKERSEVVMYYLKEEGVEDGKVLISYNMVLNDKDMTSSEKDSNRKVKFDIYK